MEYQPIVPGEASPYRRKRLIGAGIAVGSIGVLLGLYSIIPGGVRFPVIILAAPAVAIAGGIFQGITGLSLLEVNSRLPSMPIRQRAGTVATLFLLLLGVLGAFLWLSVAGRL